MLLLELGRASCGCGAFMLGALGVLELHDLLKQVTVLCIQLINDTQQVLGAVVVAAAKGDKGRRGAEKRKKPRDHRAGEFRQRTENANTQPGNQPALASTIGNKIRVDAYQLLFRLESDNHG